MTNGQNVISDYDSYLRLNWGSPIIGKVNSFTQDTFSRWMWLGVPLLVGIGTLVEFAVWLGLALPLSKLATPTAVLLSIQIGFYVGMYPVRKRYKQTGDLRPGFTLMGLYCLFIGLAGMYYGAKLGVLRVNTFADNYLAFSIYIVVVVGIGIVLLSFLKPKRT